jgi:ketosteroid isomerase-like protein
MSREEYAGHHLGGDMEFVRAVETEVVDRQAHMSGDVAWVLTRTHTSGRFRERDIDVDGVETMVLRRSGDQWRIVHVHWSSHARKAGG